YARSKTIYCCFLPAFHGLPRRYLRIRIPMSVTSVTKSRTSSGMETQSASRSITVRTEKLSFQPAERLDARVRSWERSLSLLTGTATLIYESLSAKEPTCGPLYLSRRLRPPGGGARNQH